MALGPTQPLIQMVLLETEAIPRMYNGRGVRLNTHLNLVLRLRMSGVVTVLPLYAFMARTVQ
jgi:hypothetical protein